MPQSTTDVVIPNNYANRTVQWAKNDLATVDLNIRVAFPGGQYHTPGSDELPLGIQANAPGSEKGQPRQSGGTVNVILKPI